ncbi:MAG: FlgD immunoglobulin-like domain containing protein [candidate division WOR-3 bacterium]
MIQVILLFFITQPAIGPDKNLKGIIPRVYLKAPRQTHTGFDEFGYHWIDSYEPGGPTYNWVEIDSNPITGDDVNIGPIPLPAPFWFYGINFDSIRICSNGWISFTSKSTSFNVPIPYVYEPNNTIAPFACDLFPGYFGYGSANYGTYNGKFIVEWDSVFGYNGDGPYKFEIILNSQDSSITFQYHSAPDWLEVPSTIGIEDGNGEVGLVAYQENITNQYAIRFYYIPPPDSNVGVVELLSPTDGNLLTPNTPVNLVLRVKNRGQSTVSFPVVCKIDSMGIEIFSDVQYVSNLPSNAKTDVIFTPWLPAEFFDYETILYTELPGDTVNRDDTLSKRLKAPGIVSDSGRWDDGVVRTGYYFHSEDDVIATEFIPPYYPCLIKYVAIYLLSKGDPNWTWPDSTPDPFEIGIWFDRTHDGIPDEPPVWCDIIKGDTIPPSWVYGIPPDSLVINYGNFWVGMRNIPCKGTEAVGIDSITDYPQYKWVRLNGVWQKQDYYDGDHIIRSYLCLGNLLEHDVRPLKIIEPDSITYTDTTIIPRVLVMNSGANAESFPVRLIITKDLSIIYDETVNIFNLSSRDTISAIFPAWLPFHIPGKYRVCAITNLVHDLDPYNDTLFKEIEVRIYEWRRIASMPEPRMAHATVYSPFNDKIYVIGGSPYYNPLLGQTNPVQNNCWEYDPLSDTWTIKTPMPYPLNFIYGAYCKRKIYIIGGFDSSYASVNKNQIYDIENNTWYEGDTFPWPYTASAARVVWNDSLIYCIGGLHNYRVHLYNPALDTFYECSNFNQQFLSGPACILNNTIYLIGGEYATLGFFLFDSIIVGDIQVSQPDSIIWGFYDTLPYPVCLSSANLYDDRIYMVGGAYGRRPHAEKLNKVWEYDPNSRQYLALPEHPMPRISGCQFMALKSDSGWFYTMGGDTDTVYWVPLLGPGFHIGTGTASCFKLIRHKLGITEKEIRNIPINKHFLSISPNPFRNSIKIKVQVSSYGNYSLKIYNVLGQKVKTIFNGEKQAGFYELFWDGKDDFNRKLPSGVYYVIYQMAQSKATAEVVLLR